MNGYLGDFPVGHTAVPLPFASFAGSTGASSATSGFTVDDVIVYKNGVTQRSGSPQGGITVTTSIGSRVGLNMVILDTSNDSDVGFYAAGNEYQVAVDAITVDGQTVRFWAGSFSIERAGGILALLKGANGLSNLKADTAAIKTQTDTIPQVLSVTDKLNYTLELVAGSPTAYRFTTTALALAPTGGSAPTATQIRQEMDTNSSRLSNINASTDRLNHVFEQVVGSPTEFVFSSSVRVDLAHQVWRTDLIPLASGTNGANYVTNINTVVTNIDAKTINLPTDPADASDIAALFTALNVSLSAISSVTNKLDFTMELVSGSPTAYRFTYTALSNVLNAAERNRIADHVWRRNYANIRASSDGDSIVFRSGLGVQSKLVNAWAPSGSNLEFTHEDDATVFGQQAFTSSASAEPITSLNTV